MKYNLQYLFLLLFVVAIGGYLTSCDDHYIWDFSSSEIEIEIVDEKGYSLIEPTTQWGDKRLKGIQFEFNGEKFVYQGLPAQEQELRAIPERYRAVGIKKEKSQYFFTFGEFQPNYVKSEIKLQIPEVGEYSIVFTFNANPVGRKPNVTRGLWVDGEKQMIKSNHPFRVRLVVDRTKWESYNPSPNSPTYLPMTLYFIGNQVILLDNLASQNIFVVYNGKKHKLEKEYKGDPIYCDSLVLVQGKSAFLNGEQGYWERPFLAFGPFDPIKNYEKETLTLSVEGVPYRVEFSAKLNKEGRPVYDATLSNAIYPNYERKKMYFRNGSLIFLPR